MSKHKRPQAAAITRHAPGVPPDDIRAQTIQGPEVEFLEWQQTSSGDIFPLYNVLTKGPPSYRSAVTGKTLQTLHLRTPQTPSPYPNVGPAPWHNLGTELVNVATAREAIEAAGLSYTVAKKPLGDMVKPNHPADVSDLWAIVRTDTGDVLGIVGDSYEPIQNSDAFTFFDNLVRTNEAVYETAGVIGRGERVWILATLPGFIRVRGKDVVNKYVLLTNSHFGGSPVCAKLTPIRVACNNTLTGAHQRTSEVHFRHTRNANENLAQAATLLGLSYSAYRQLNITFNRMALRMISEKELLDYVRALAPDNEEGEDNARTKEIRDKVLCLHESGQGSSLARGTLWGAYNSVTEYTDHLMVDVDPTKRLESIWFGRGEQLKVKAFQLAQRMM